MNGSAYPPNVLLPAMELLWEGLLYENIRCTLPLLLLALTPGGVAPAVVLAPIDGRALCGDVMNKPPDLREAFFVVGIVGDGRTAPSRAVIFCVSRQYD
jgi:hypothetical protein